jgi:hypothetical protein
MNQNTLQQMAAKWGIPVEVLAKMLTQQQGGSFAPQDQATPWAINPAITAALKKRNRPLPKEEEEEDEDRMGAAWDKVQKRKGGLMDTFGGDGSFGREGGLIERWGGKPGPDGREGGILRSIFGGMF